MSVEAADDRIHAVGAAVDRFAGLSAGDTGDSLILDREVERLTADSQRPSPIRRVPVDSDTDRGYCPYADITDRKRRERERTRRG